MQWSRLKKLTEDRFADKLKGRVHIHITCYRRGNDDEVGRFWIVLDKQEIFSSGDGFSPKHDEWYFKEGCVVLNRLNGHCSSDEALLHSPNLSIEEMLIAPQELIKALAMFDKRVGKRRLQELAPTMKDEPLLVQHFFALRCEAEGVSFEGGANCQTPKQ